MTRWKEIEWLIVLGLCILATGVGIWELRPLHESATVLSIIPYTATGGIITPAQVTLYHISLQAEDGRIFNLDLGCNIYHPQDRLQIIIFDNNHIVIANEPEGC